MCCRICLAKNVHKDVSELQFIPEIDKNHQDIMLFCFDIQVSEDPLVSRSLCTKCYKKVISFYIFKLQAIKNDVYLRSQHTKEEVKDTDINNQTSDISEVEDEPEIKIEYVDEPEIKIEYDDFQLDQSDQLDIWEDQNELNLNVKAEDTPDTETEESDNEVPSVLKTEKANNIYKEYSTDEDYVPDEEIKTTLRKCKPSTETCKFVCVICKKQFPRQPQLDSHFKSHGQERPYQCDICNGKYWYKSGLTMHIKRVHNKKPHMCHLCSKTFAQKNRFEIHLRLHSNERPFACDKCGKKFFCRVSLKNHAVTHTEGKTNDCPICDKKFYTQRGRNSHMLTHSKGFRRTGHRNGHERNKRAGNTESTTNEPE